MRRIFGKNYLFFIKHNLYCHIFFYLSDLIIIREGKETDEFWDFLGGEEEYASMPRLAVS